MWPSFFPGTEEERGARPGRVRRAQEEGKEGARRLSLLLGLAGLVLMVTAAGSDFWAELKGQAGAHNFTCQAAHFGLWRQCVKTIEVQELEPGAGLCGPVELPGVSNCSYFRFFMTGEKTYIVDREAPKELFVLVAVFTVLCLCLMTMGSISISTSPRNHRRFLLNLSATFYITAGGAAVGTLISFHQAVRTLWVRIGTEGPALSYSWSFGCALASSVTSSLTGISLLLLLQAPSCSVPWGRGRKDGAV